MSASPPPTPPSGALIDDEWRFEPITLPCEWVEDYRPGGYHPAVLGDVFYDGQYKAIRKLGDGSYSTVWLARDLKFLSEISGSTTELRFLRHITEVAPAEGARHITRLLGEFEHRGPNGAHRWLVFESMGPSVNTMFEELPQFIARMQANEDPLTASDGKEHPQAILAGSCISPCSGTRKMYKPSRFHLMYRG